MSLARFVQKRDLATGWSTREPDRPLSSPTASALLSLRSLAGIAVVHGELEFPRGPLSCPKFKEHNTSGVKPFVMLRVKTHRADPPATKDRLVKKAARKRKTGQRPFRPEPSPVPGLQSHQRDGPATGEPHLQ